MIAPVRTLAIGLLLGSNLLGTTAQAEDHPPPIVVSLRNHQFFPAEIHVPTGKPAFLHVVNEDATPEEFEVRQLAIEKVIAAGGSGEVRLRPLGPGRYAFIGEFHADTATGTIIAE
ncbi:cupredoxin domain-containing protein [Telmatospirillum sp.]|uniref:cupredoxin domain-containing protein n=1 Tax=Telmatospirillum sp. TaxID=2079197 RepID=UPI00284CBB0F|nr:cupredoxin domain-containing protein [Telmatospirillum sp.]MDR3438293.1 cupredoxin domain-containing protein [Telmatospirillum sp.]